jgi:hypothetical protein
VKLALWPDLVRAVPNGVLRFCIVWRDQKRAKIGLGTAGDSYPRRLAVNNGIPVPAFSASLAYYDS